MPSLTIYCIRKNRTIRHFQVFCQKNECLSQIEWVDLSKVSIFSLYSVKTMPLIQPTYSSFSFDFLILSTFVALDTGFSICYTQSNEWYWNSTCFDNFDHCKISFLKWKCICVADGFWRHKWSWPFPFQKENFSQQQIGFLTYHTHMNQST